MGENRIKVFKEKNINFNRVLLNTIIILISTFLIVYLEEYIFRGEFLTTSIWIKNSFKIFMLNYILVLICYIIICMIIKNVGISYFLVNIFTLGLTAINYYKFEFKGEVLTFSDFGLSGEAIDILSNYKINIDHSLVVSLLITIICTFILLKISIFNMNRLLNN